MKYLFSELRRTLNNLNAIEVAVICPVVVGLVMLVFAASVQVSSTSPAKTTAKEKSVLAGISCPECVYVPKGLQRLETSMMIEGSKVTLPTQSYLAHLQEVCRNAPTDIAKGDCSWRLNEIRYGVDDVYSRVNPPYGRPPLTEVQLKYVLWGSDRIGQLLAVIEYHHVGDNWQHYVNEKRSS